MGAKGTGIIFGGGVYVAENTLGEEEQRRICSLRRSAVPVSIGRWEPTKCILHFVGEEEQRND